MMIFLFSAARGEGIKTFEGIGAAEKVFEGVMGWGLATRRGAATDKGLLAIGYAVGDVGMHIEHVLTDLWRKGETITGDVRFWNSEQGGLGVVGFAEFQEHVIPLLNGSGGEGQMELGADGLKAIFSHATQGALKTVIELPADDAVEQQRDDDGVEKKPGQNAGVERGFHSGAVLGVGLDEKVAGAADGADVAGLVGVVV